MDIQLLYEIYCTHPVICNDTRRISPGCIYWGIKGERFDGNSFAAQALEQGAAFAVVDNPKYELNDRCLLVEDSIASLQALARHHRRTLDIPIIGITGSNGKTTTKELMYRVLSAKFKTFATPGNLNNHIGLPLSLLMLNKEHEIAIIELGANHQGENTLLTEICEPTHGIVTNIGKDHLEGFGGMEGVEKAQLELFDVMEEQDGGMAFINADDERISKHSYKLKNITYGLPGADVSGEVLERFPFLKAKLKLPGVNEFMVNTQLFGAFHLYNILAATVTGLAFGVPPGDMKIAMESYVPDNMRSQMIKQGTNTIILDAYNANPSSMQLALKDFEDYPADNKVLILGDMFELGDESEAEHKALLKMIPFDKFIKVALAGKDFYRFEDAFPGFFFQDTATLLDWYKKQNFAHATIYIKGSRSMKLEQLVEMHSH